MSDRDEIICFYIETTTFHLTYNIQVAINYFREFLASPVTETMQLCVLLLILRSCVDPIDQKSIIYCKCVTLYK